MTKLIERLKRAETIKDVEKILKKSGVDLSEKEAEEIYKAVKAYISDENLEKIAGGMASRYDIML